MPRGSREQSRATATRVLDVARRMFAEVGFAEVSLDAIAVAATVTRGAIYNHYGSKRGLFAAVFAEVHREVAVAVEAAAEEAGETWEGFRAGCRAFLVASLDDSVRRIMLLDAPAVLGWDAWRAEDSANSARLLDEGLHELVEAGLMTDGSIEEIGALLSGAMNSASLHIAESDDPDLAFERSWAVLERLLEALR